MNPKSRKDDLVIQDLEGELFIYDLKTDSVYSLNSTSAFIWNNLDGENSVADLARRTGKHFNQPVGEDLILLAIDGLRQVNLLEEETAPKPMSKLKRREAIKRVGLATMVALPVIASLVAPTALSAASGGTICQPCTSNAQCTAPATCKPTYGMGVNTCTISSQPSTNRQGVNISAGDVDNCNMRAAQYCCRGTATFTAPNSCVCN